MKKFIKVLTLVLVVGLVFFGVRQMLSTQKKEVSRLQQVVIAVGSGYGYQIFNGDKLLVQQEFIPAVVGKQTFASPKDAQQVANLVMSKIKKRTSPKVTLDELKDLDIVILEP